MSNVFAFATTELHFSLCCTVVVCQTLKRYFFTINSLFLDIDVQIENNRLYFQERAQSKCGSLDYIDHIPGGGDKLVWNQLTAS